MNASFVVFFPLFFLSDAVVPKQALTGWLSAIATYNPITYLLGALRSLITSGWQAGTVLGGPRGARRDRAREHDARPGGAQGKGHEGCLMTRDRT